MEPKDAAEATGLMQEIAQRVNCASLGCVKKDVLNHKKQAQCSVVANYKSQAEWPPKPRKGDKYQAIDAIKEKRNRHDEWPPSFDIDTVEPSNNC